MLDLFHVPTPQAIYISPVSRFIWGCAYVMHGIQRTSMRRYSISPRCIVGTYSPPSEQIKDTDCNATVRWRHLVIRLQVSCGRSRSVVVSRSRSFRSQTPCYPGSTMTVTASWVHEHCATQGLTKSHVSINQSINSLLSDSAAFTILIIMVQRSGTG